MNLSAIGPLLGLATQLLGGASPLGMLGSLASGATGPGASQGASNDPLAAILALTERADGLATGGLGGSLGSIAGLLA